jgi:hypothetical protein
MSLFRDQHGKCRLAVAAERPSACRHLGVVKTPKLGAKSFASANASIANASPRAGSARSAPQRASKLPERIADFFKLRSIRRKGLADGRSAEGPKVRRYWERLAKVTLGRGPRPPGGASASMRNGFADKGDLKEPAARSEAIAVRRTWSEPVK